MTVNIGALLVIIVVAGICWYANNTLNSVPTLKNVVNVLIVAVSVLLVLSSLGLINNGLRISVH